MMCYYGLQECPPLDIYMIRRVYIVHTTPTTITLLLLLQRPHLFNGSTQQQKTFEAVSSVHLALLPDSKRVAFGQNAYPGAFGSNLQRLRRSSEGRAVHLLAGFLVMGKGISNSVDPTPPLTQRKKRPEMRLRLSAFFRICEPRFSSLANPSK